MSAFLCILTEGHEGQHLSIDNRQYWQDSPGGPVRWGQDEEKQPVSSPSRLAKVLDAKTKGFEGVACADCGAMRMIRAGKCLQCTSCGSTSGGCS